MKDYIVHFRILGTTISEGFTASEKVEATDVIGAQHRIEDRYEKSVDIEGVNQL